MNADETYEELRPLLFSVAYRMLGSVMDAEDVVQEAFLRWQKTDVEVVVSPKAFLTSIVTRLSIDQLRSARRKREVYVGEWLPEPLVADLNTAQSPDELADSLSTAFLVLLETLSPNERAAFLLREVFDCDYKEIAAALGKSEANSRQIVRRAKGRLAGRDRRFVVTADEHQRLTEAFIGCIGTGDYEGLSALFAEEAVLHTDHGGKALSARRPIFGPDHITRLFLGLMRRPENQRLDSRVMEVNGRPGLVLLDGAQVFGVFSFHIQDGLIQTLYFMRNPEKLSVVPIPPGPEQPQ